MKALERAEHSPRVGHVEARAVVAHVENLRPPSRPLPRGEELDARPLALRTSELPGVAQEVVEHGVDESTVRDHHDRFLDGESDPATRLTALELGSDAGGLRAEIDRFLANDCTARCLRGATDRR